MTDSTSTLARDPVCGMNVNPATAKYSAEHSGKKYFFCCGGCADKFLSHPQQYLNKPASGLITLGMPAPAASLARDPVCGMNVNPTTAKHIAEHSGKKYYFCCGGCAEKFRAAPQTYLSKSVSIMPAAHAHPLAEQPKAEVQGPKPDVAYVCPMCPEVRGSKPGACPSCGMALEPETPLAATRTEYTCPMHPEIVRSEPGSCPICGMALEPRTVTAAQEENPELRDMTRRFWISVILTAPLLAIAMGSMIWPGEFMQILHGSRLPWFELILASPVVLWCGLPFFQRFWTSGSRRRPV